MRALKASVRPVLSRPLSRQTSLCSRSLLPNTQSPRPPRPRLPLWRPLVLAAAAPAGTRMASATAAWLRRDRTGLGPPVQVGTPDHMTGWRGDHRLPSLSALGPSAAAPCWFSLQLVHHYPSHSKLGVNLLHKRKAKIFDQIKVMKELLAVDFLILHLGPIQRITLMLKNNLQSKII